MKLKELYDPIIEGSQKVGFLEAVNNLYPLHAEWFNSIDVKSLDRYILFNIGKRTLFEYFASNTDKTTYHYIYDLLKANEYKLNGLYDSTTYSDEYSPIENYDKYSDTTTTIGARKSKTTNGNRETDTEFGAYTDTNTTTNSDTAFDTTPDYTNPTSKSVNEMQNATHTDKVTSLQSEDKIETDSAEDKFHEHTHGNIGVMRVDQMLEGQRNVVNYVFFNEILYLLQSNILNNCLWFEEEE